MDKTTARRIADSLTWVRIWSAVPITILAWYELAWWVFGLYIIAALTDLFDGYFARRGTPPKEDSDFDGKADVIFSIMTLVWIWLLIPGFFEKYWFPYLPVLLLIEIYLVTLRIHRSGIHIPHFRFGRFAMTVFCFLLPVLLVIHDNAWFVHAVFIIGTLSKLQLAWHFRIVAKPVCTEQASA